MKLFTKCPVIAALIFLPFARTPALAISQTPLSAPWVTNGLVYSIATTASTVYLGGSFSYVGPYTGGGVLLDSTSGALQTFPAVNGNVYAVLSDGFGGWYIGGDFTLVGG